MSIPTVYPPRTHDQRQVAFRPWREARLGIALLLASLRSDRRRQPDSGPGGGRVRSQLAQLSLRSLPAAVHGCAVALVPAPFADSATCLENTPARTLVVRSPSYSPPVGRRPRSDGGAGTAVPVPQGRVDGHAAAAQSHARRRWRNSHPDFSFGVACCHGPRKPGRQAVARGGPMLQCDCWKSPAPRPTSARGQHRLDISRADRHHTFAVAAGLPMAACSRIDDLSIETLLFLCNLPIPNLPWPATGRGINPLSTIQPSGAWSRLLNKVRRNRNSSTRFAEPSGAASHVPGKIRPSPINSPISGTRSRCPRLAGDQTPP